MNFRYIHILFLFYKDAFCLGFVLPEQPRHNARASRVVSSALPRCLCSPRLLQTTSVIRNIRIKINLHIYIFEIESKTINIKESFKQTLSCSNFFFNFSH